MVHFASEYAFVHWQQRRGVGAIGLTLLEDPGGLLDPHPGALGRSVPRKAGCFKVSFELQFFLLGVGQNGVAVDVQGDEGLVEVIHVEIRSLWFKKRKRFTQNKPKMAVKSNEAVIFNVFGNKQSGKIN